MNQSTISARQTALIEEFSLFDDWMDRYAMIIDMAKELAPFAEEDHQDAYLIKGCQSKVWLTASKAENGNICYRADSDAIITKGLVAMMIQVLSDAPAQEILNADLNFIRAIGLQEHLSLTRSNGLAAMVKQMKIYALALSGK